jgi:hypothetical protein
LQKIKRDDEAEVKIGAHRCSRRRLRAVGFLDRIFGRSRGEASKQEADPHALDRAGDPRGGVQSDEYRQADPRDLVEEDGTVMSGPGGSPQEGTSPEERRREQS